MTSTIPPPARSSATVSAFVIHQRHYEARLIDCGKLNCQRCGGHDERHPSHGPYWYLCTTRKGRWFRIYLGKELDTTAFVTSSGNIDWKAITARRAGRKLSKDEKSKQPPGQLDLVDVPLALGANPIEEAQRQARAAIAHPDVGDVGALVPTPAAPIDPPDPDDPGPLPAKPF